MESSVNEPSSSLSIFEPTSENEQSSVLTKSDADSHGYDYERKHSRKIIHFCDGALEECDPSEDEPDTKSDLKVDPKTLPWGPWLLYQTTTAGTKTLQVMDYLGETFANFFGITTPKYQYEIDEYEIMQAEEEEEKKTQDLEMGGWTGPTIVEKSNSSENVSQNEEKLNTEITDGPIRSQPTLTRILYFFAPSMQPKVTYF